MTKSLNEQYFKFVDGVTSEASKNDEAWVKRIQELEEDFNKVGMSGQVSRLTTAAFGLNGEAAEVSELVKKVLFHGKPMTQEIKDKLIDECSDVCWYVANLCMALDVSLDDVMKHNIKKLESRYPGGKFSVHHSENRQENYKVSEVLEDYYIPESEEKLNDDSIVSYRIQESPERRVFYIDVGALSTDKAKEIIEKIKAETTEKRA